MRKRIKGIGILGVSAVCSAAMAMVSFGATGWAMEGDEWCYYEKDGNKAEDVFKKSGENWFYLGSDGRMVRSSIVEVDDNYYYVNSVGAMVSNEWREVENEDGDSDEPDTWWYYLSSNGRAVRQTGSNAKVATLPTKAGNAKFIFDEMGRMMSGWIGADGQRKGDLIFRRAL